MGKYLGLESDVFSLFNSDEWIAENIKTFPVNFTPINIDNEYIVIDIIPSGKGLNKRSLSGIVIIDVYIAAGEGPKRASLIADILDNYLANKSLTTSQNVVTQFNQSTFKSEGIDKDDSDLARFLYTIPFNYFGVE